MKNIAFFLIFPPLLVAGCAKTPEGFPKIVPCIVSVERNGEPLAGVFVQVETVPRTDSLVIGGRTDENGKAVMRTRLGTYFSPGVPIGKLCMTLKKEPEVPPFKTKEEIEKMTDAEALAYGVEIGRRRAKLPRIIPALLQDRDRSPLLRETSLEESVDWKVDLEEYE